VEAVLFEKILELYYRFHFLGYEVLGFALRQAQGDNNYG
jgi:hypothetical protein